MAMAVSFAINSSFLATKPSQKPFCSSFNNTPFLGFSLAASPKPSFRINKSRIFCQEKAALVPANQQWMFDCITGPDLLNKTWYPKAEDHVNTDKPWYVVDATDKILGRLASTISIYIRGKNLATYTPSVDMGAFVIVVCG